MTFLFRIIISFFLLFNLSGTSAQQSVNNADNVYGSDPLLFNGRYYTFFLPLNTGGNQYFSDLQFELGSATIRSVTYSEVAINYDIYNQQLVLQYKNNMGSANLIIISDAWLESFSFKGLNFEMISSQDTMKKIFQVLGTGRYRILYYWKKTLNLDSFQGSKNHTFSAAKKEMNIYTGTQILRYRNNKIFYSLFDADKKNSIKEYLLRNKINVKKANDQTMIDLIHYCNSIYSK